MAGSPKKGSKESEADSHRVSDVAEPVVRHTFILDVESQERILVNSWNLKCEMAPNSAKHI